MKSRIGLPEFRRRIFATLFFNHWFSWQRVLKHLHSVLFVARKRGVSHPCTTESVITVLQLLMRQFYFVSYLVVGSDHVSGTATSLRPIGHPQGNRWMNIVWWWNGSCQGISEARSEKPVPLLLSPPQMSRGLSWERTQVSGMRTCVSAGPLIHQSLQMKTYIKFETNSPYFY